ncbi:hypothetical protein LOH54_08540 [Sulfurimonas sp. HSL-3221]|uniref:hypothetical protein n=1 Tax=Sulfurimonadaceae TaxID=2771471 RepID=UPI001E5B8853|nr:hypothetical protein [Sulfurimonas sp. HSL-3221]UFS61710.1 hypothetical protein LOH54_08540 [Sulfurimonas sp. HSL-3221]
MDWNYHVLQKPESGVITMRATSMDPQGVLEVMRIREIAEEFRLYTKWDGQDIVIGRKEE